MSNPNTWYSNLETQEALSKLPEDDKSTILAKHQEEANKIYVEKKVANILENNHPRAQELYDWIMRNEKIKEWYVANNDKIKLIPNWIEVNWEIISLEDFVPKKSHLLRFRKNLITRKDVDETWKKIPDFEKISNIFKSLDTMDVYLFYINVLWLKSTAFWLWPVIDMQTGWDGYYWSKWGNVMCVPFLWNSTLWDTEVHFIKPKIKSYRAAFRPQY